MFNTAFTCCKKEGFSPAFYIFSLKLVVENTDAQNTKKDIWPSHLHLHIYVYDLSLCVVQGSGLEWINDFSKSIHVHR